VPFIPLPPPGDSGDDYQHGVFMGFAKAYQWGKNYAEDAAEFAKDPGDPSGSNAKDMADQLASAYEEWASNFCATMGVAPPGGAALQQGNMGYFNDEPDDPGESSNLGPGSDDGTVAVDASIGAAGDDLGAEKAGQAADEAQAEGKEAAAAKARQYAQTSAQDAQQQADVACSAEAGAAAEGSGSAPNSEIAAADAKQSAQDAEESAQS
jgi:colicin import membrane protein